MRPQRAAACRGRLPQASLCRVRAQDLGRTDPQARLSRPRAGQGDLARSRKGAAGTLLRGSPRRPGKPRGPGLAGAVRGAAAVVAKAEAAEQAAEAAGCSR